MSSRPSVLLLGGTGRTGRRVLAELLDRGVPVRAVVRSAARLPEGAAGHPLLTVVDAQLLLLSREELQRHLAGCAVMMSCLGHTLSLTGVFGPPRDLVAQAVRRVADAAGAAARPEPLRLILMSSVSVNRPDRADTRRGWDERALLWALRGALPPARDNQRAADVLAGKVGADSEALRWVVVRPDTLLEGDASAYDVHDELVAGLFRPASTRMANVARFMADLATDEATWRRWQGRMPVIVDARADEARTGPHV